MTTYYVGPGGNDGNSGETWALRKLTLAGVGDAGLHWGDVVYVAPGVYRETLTVAKSGSAGASVITYIGDKTGEHTDGVGGLVRITGSNDDKTMTRSNCILVDGFNYRTFRGFHLEGSTASACSMYGCKYCTFELSSISGSTKGVAFDSTANSLANTVQNCYLGVIGNNVVTDYNGGVEAGNPGHLVQSCIIGPWSGGWIPGVRITKGGGFTIKNCAIMGGYQGLLSDTTGHSPVYIYNSMIMCCTLGIQAQVVGDIVEDYNTFWGNGTDRTNVAVGAHSVSYPALFDTRWFPEVVSGKGRMVTPFDLASYSQLLNLAGTAPPATDLRGAAVIGAQREWGPLEYDPALLYRRVIGRQC